MVQEICGANIKLDIMSLPFRCIFYSDLRKILFASVTWSNYLLALQYFKFIFCYELLGDILLDCL